MGDDEDGEVLNLQRGGEQHEPQGIKGSEDFEPLAHLWVLSKLMRVWQSNHEL